MSRSRAAGSLPLQPDQESRRSIREDLATNLLVEAGAGSGKTQMLAERMAAGIASGAYNIEHLAAVTFTRKAASELRGRFHLALEAHVAQGSDPADAETRVHHALGNLERFFAGTIHAFCARLLRERPVEAGVSPGFTELDEVRDEELRNRSWRDFISSARSSGDRDILALLDTSVRPRDLDSAFAILCLNNDVEFPPGDAVCPDPTPAWKALEKFWNGLEKHLPSSINPETTCDIQRAALNFRRQLRVARKRLDRPATVASLLETWDCESKIIQKHWADSAAGKKRFKDLIQPTHAAFHAAVVEPFLNQWRQYVYRLSVTLLAHARDHAARERRRQNCLNYGDLLSLTAKVLRTNAQVRHALQRKFRHLFVDEFQDTDPIQAEIVFLLAASESAVARPFRAVHDSCPDWRTVPVRPGALFVVGDPKQSIYRFRRADIEIYNIVRDRFSDPAVGQILPLTTNFRSVPALCEWANEVFVTQFPPEPTRHAPRFAPLHPNKERAKESGGVFTLTHACSDYRDVPVEDAAAVARYIRSEVDAGRRKYSQFLVLTRKKKDRLAPYANALEQLNIPIEVSGAGAFGDSREVKGLTVLLRSLADPQDQLSLIAVLRGPLFGISDPELFAFKQAGGWFSIFYDEQSPVAQPFKAAHDTVSSALAALRQHHRWTRILPAGAALDRILESTGYLALAATTPAGVEAGDLVHAIDRVRQEVESGGSLADAADALEMDGDFSSEIESLPLEPGRTDVVRLMNLHKAKGLEADVVFLVDPCGGTRPRVDVHIERSGARALGWFKLEKRSENSYAGKLLGRHADWPQHEAAELPFLQAEETRLLYVAATRARDVLVVSRQTPVKGAQAWGAVNRFLPAARELPVPATVSVAAPELPVCSPDVVAASQAARASAHAAANTPSWSITSVTAEAKHIAKMARAADADADDATGVVTQNTPSHRADAGMAWGTLIHGLLEHAMRHKDATREDLRRLAMWLTVEDPQLRAVIDEAVNTVLGMAASVFWQAARGVDHSAEVPFTVVSDPRRLVNGVVDLLYSSGDGWAIVDYKTDVGLSVSTAEQYRDQLAQYVRALQACGLVADGAAIYPVRSVEVSAPGSESKGPQ